VYHELSRLFFKTDMEYRTMHEPAPFLNATAAAANVHYEQRYYVPIPNTDAYELVSGAVWYTLIRLAPGYRIVADRADAAVCYYLSQGILHLQLIVRKVTTHAATVQLFFLVPTDPIAQALLHQLPLSAFSEVGALVFERCHMEVQAALRTAATIEDHIPDPPVHLGWPAVIEWKDTYYPKWTDSEVANLPKYKKCKLNAKTMRNERSKLKQQRESLGHLGTSEG
jgi:hypothetical protein